jgi:hypothetical protein
MIKKRIEEEISAVTVSLKDLLLACEEIHRSAPKDKDWEGRLITLARVFKGQRGKAMAVEYRLAAMTRILESNLLPGWAKPIAPDGTVSVSEPVWLATASEPLVFDEDEPRFEELSFRDAVIAIAPIEGSA